LILGILGQLKGFLESMDQIISQFGNISYNFDNSVHTISVRVKEYNKTLQSSADTLESAIQGIMVQYNDLELQENIFIENKKKLEEMNRGDPLKFEIGAMESQESYPSIDTMEGKLIFTSTGYTVESKIDSWDKRELERKLYQKMLAKMS
jgi:hypothetical protein